MKLKITIDKQVYEVEVEVAEPDVPVVRYATGSNRPAAGAPSAPVAAASGGRQPDDEKKSCRSPLAGVVSEIKVAVGDTVDADQDVIVLEAMKMFTTITSPIAGKIRAIDVEKGASVKQGQLLLEVE
jgi:biotin carboxyl carrier protein